MSLIENIIEISQKAGDIIMKIYENDFNIYIKEDKSPVTEADQAADDYIRQELHKITPEIPIISEENIIPDYEERKNWAEYWLVDPLDGTKEFIKKNGEFTVNIALIKNNKAILGVVYLPVNKTTYYAAKDQGAFKTSNKGKQKLPLQNKLKDCEITIATGRNSRNIHFQEFREELKKTKTVHTHISGSSIKFCLVAEGLVQIYPRFGPTMEWDSAASQIIVEEAGFSIEDFKTKKKLTYNKVSLKNPWIITH